MTLIEAALKDIGQQEKEATGGFIDNAFAAAMHDVGYITGWPWASLLIYKWIREAMPARAEELEGYFVPSSMASFRNLKNAFYQYSLIPEAGTVVYWQKYEEGRALWLGHCGVVSRVVSGTEFYSVEAWQGEVTEMHRHYRKVIHDGLKVVGFVTL